MKIEIFGKFTVLSSIQLSRLIIHCCGTYLSKFSNCLKSVCFLFNNSVLVIFIRYKLNQALCSEFPSINHSQNLDSLQHTNTLPLTIKLPQTTDYRLARSSDGPPSILLLLGLH